MEVLRIGRDVKAMLNRCGVDLQTATGPVDEDWARVWGWTSGKIMMLAASPNYDRAVLVKESKIIKIEGPELDGFEVTIGGSMVRFEDRSALFWDIPSGRGVYVWREGGDLIAMARKFGDSVVVRVTR